MKKEIDIWIENNNPKGIIYEGKFYIIKSLETQLSQPLIPKSYSITTSYTKKTKGKDKGKKLANVRNTAIYENILNDIIQNGGLINTYTARDIIKNYYPNFKQASIKAVATQYIGYAKRNCKLPLMTKEQGEISKGKFIKKFKGALIYENPANDIKYFIDNGMSRAGLEEILQKYYPNIKMSSVKKYMVGYLSYLKSTGVDISHLTKSGPKIGVKYKTKRRRRNGKNPPSSNCAGFSKTYKTWIKDFELKEVQRLLNMVKYDYKTTVKNMIKESYLARPDRVRATLDYLQQEGKVIKESDGNTYTYKMI